MVMFEIPDAGTHAPILIEHQQMPALLVLGRPIETVMSQLMRFHRAVPQVNAPTQPLRVGHELRAPARVLLTTRAVPSALAKRVIATTQSESGCVFVPYEQVYGGIEDMLHRIPALDKIKDEIGWEPAFDLEQILADVIQHARTTLPSQNERPVAEAVAAG